MQVGLEAASAQPTRWRSWTVALLRVPGIVTSLAFCLVAGLLALMWVPLAPTRLFDFDAANFALALGDFQPQLHQPQPPGYPLYVGLTKIINLVAGDPAVAFLIAGLLGATVAIVLLWSLGERMFGRTAGIFAGLLLMTNPILWQTGMSDQVRIYIAVISVAVAVAVWPLWTTPSPPRTRPLVVGCALLGVLSGFRPEMLVSMAPLLLVVAIRGRMKFRQYLAGAVALCVGIAPWLIVLLARVGGIENFVTMMRIYSAEQAGRSSLLFGASWAGAWKMLTGGVWWASLGIVTWLPALPFVEWRKMRDDAKRQGYFLLVWFLSLFLFSIVVHIAASGHSLGFIPVLCLAGGWVLSNARRFGGRRLMLLCGAGALCLNVAFFFRPYGKRVIEASYLSVGSIARVNEKVMNRIDSITRANVAYLVTDGEWVSWRLLEYYYPNNRLLYLAAPTAAPKAPRTAWEFENRALSQSPDANAEIPLPSCGTIIWLLSDDQSRQDLLRVKDAESFRFMIDMPVHPGMRFRAGRYQMATSSQPCRKEN